MTLIDERWIKQEVESNHKECYASGRILCECCGLASAHVDVEGVPLCCYCVAAEELEEQRAAIKKAYAENAPGYARRREARLKLIANQEPQVN